MIYEFLYDMSFKKVAELGLGWLWEIGVLSTFLTLHHDQKHIPPVAM